MFNTADLFDEFDADPLEQLNIESRIEYLQGWHRDLTDEMNEASRQLHRIQIGREKEDGASALENLLIGLKIRRAEIDEKVAELIAEFQGKPGKAISPEGRRKSTGLARVRHANRDFFLADLIDYSLKDDHSSMETSIFTIATKRDLSIWKWISPKGDKWVEITPSVLGRATMHDKDVLIYAMSQIAEALNRGRSDAENRTVQFTAYDFLVTTNRGVGGADYKRLEEALDRLKGTNIKTNIVTGGKEQKRAFGLIETWEMVTDLEKKENVSIRIVLSEWFFNAVQAFEVLTIPPDYFLLKKPLARRLYEIARKHCGGQSGWKIGLEKLKDKCGSRSSTKEFRRMLKAIEEENSLPEYRVELEKDGQVSFFSKRVFSLVAGK